MGKIWDGYIKGRKGYRDLAVINTYNFLGKYCRVKKRDTSI